MYIITWLITLNNVSTIAGRNVGLKRKKIRKDAAGVLSLTLRV